VNDYLQRTGNGIAYTMRKGLALYVWSEQGLLAAVNKARDEVDTIQPDVVVLHDSPSALLRDLETAVARVRAWHPWCRVHVGAGMDGTVAQWRRGEVSAERVIAPLEAVAKLCERLRVECVVWNGESQWKDTGTDAVSMAQIEELARALGERTSRAAPSCVHWLSSFDQPTLHAALRGFMRGFTPFMSAYTGQAYVAVAGGAPRGALDRRLNAAARSQELAERAGMLPDDLEGAAETPRDCDRIASIQVYATPLADVVAAAVRYPMLALWAAPLVAEHGRMDPAGLTAIAFAQVVRRSGCTSVAEWQQARGLKPDGIVGPRTLIAAGLRPLAP